MDFLSFLLSTLFFSLVIHVLALFRKNTLPPGPIGLPLFGNLFDIGPKPHESFAKLAKKYGPLITIRLGSVTSIVASSPEMAREILQKNDEAISGRVIPDAMTTLDHTAHAVAWMSAGDEWRMLRRVLSTFLIIPQKLDTFRAFRYKVVDEMVEYVKGVSRRKEAVGISKLAFTTALNQMGNTCFSVNVADFESEDVKGFQAAVKTIMEIDVKFNVSDYFPWLKGFDPQGLRKKARDAYGCLEGLCDKFIDQRLKEREYSLLRNGDLLDSLLDFSQANESDFTLKHIQVLLVELFLAGTETSSITTEWAVTELIRHPTIMANLRQELAEKMGAKHMITESEILGLPYLQAVVKETMRLHLSVPLLVPHKTETEVRLSGYIIPKNTQVLVNAWAIARDANYWDNPTRFMPERFLGSELDFKGHHFSFLPFGSGRRICPGISLAQRVVSLMIASLVSQFHWELPRGMTLDKLDMNDRFGLTLQRATPLLAVPTALR